jgi:hypothetical protein
MQARVHPFSLQRPLQIAGHLREHTGRAYDRLPCRSRKAHEKGPHALPPVDTSPPRPRTVARALDAIVAALVLALAAGVLAGCGSSRTIGTSADPAGAVPAAVPLYASAIVRPDGPLKAAALSAGRTLTHQANPYLRLLQVLQTPGSPALDFKRDVAPWMGAHAGIFLSSLEGSARSSSDLLSLLGQGLLGGSPATSAFPFGANPSSTGAAGGQGAIVLDTRDATRARSFLDSEAQRARAHAAVYRGVAYQTTSGGVAFGVVDRFAVIGSESGLHGVIDTTLGGPSLAHASGYEKLLASAPSGALAHVYANPGVSPPGGGPSASAGSSSPSVSSGASLNGGAQGLSGLLGLLAGTRQLDVSLVPSIKSVALDADTLASSSAAKPGGLLSSSAEGARALGELPGESWLAIGLGNVGTTLAEDVGALRTLALLGGSSAQGATSGINLKGLLEGILSPLGALSANSPQARHDFQSWMGSAGVFASGNGLLELKAGVVIASKSPALSRAAVAKLAALLRKAGGSVQPVSISGTDASVAARLTGLPVALDIADGHDANGNPKFVIGLGEASVAAALNPPSTLSGAASHGAAALALGEGAQPSIIVDFTTLLSLLEGVGLSEDPTISKLVPSLRALTTLAGGGKSLGGGVERFRLVVGLQG